MVVWENQLFSFIEKEIQCDKSEKKKKLKFDNLVNILSFL